MTGSYTLDDWDGHLSKFESLGLIQNSSPLQNKTLDEAPTSSIHDSLFTPPPSELSSTPEPLPPTNWKKSQSRIVTSPAPRKMRTVATHVLVPSMSKPKSQYVWLSSLVNPSRKRRRTAQEGLKDVLNSVWQNNDLLGWPGEHEDDDGKRKKRKKNHKAQASPIAGFSDGDSVVFVKRPPTVKHRMKEKLGEAKTTIIDLTLDNDEEEKPLIPLSAPTQSIVQVPEVISPPRQPESEETRIRIGVVHSISYRTLLFNTRFLRGTQGDIVHTTDLHKDVTILLPVRRRRALFDNHLELPSSMDDGFSLGSPVVTKFGQNTFDQEYDDDDDDDDDDLGYDVMELLDSSSGSPVSKHVLSPRKHPPSDVDEAMVCPPKIDLAAFQKKRTASVRRISSILTPSARNGAPPSTLTSGASHSSASSLRNKPVQDMVSEDDPHTPLVPSAKALGKRKAVDSPLQPLQLCPNVQTPFSSLQTMLETPPAYSFDSFINYGPTSPDRSMLSTDNSSSYLGAGEPYSYSNFTLSNINFVDQCHHIPTFASADDYPGLPNDVNPFALSVLDGPPQSEMNFLPAWPSELESFPCNNGTINPSLLGGEPLGMSEQSVSYVPAVENEFFDAEKEEESPAIGKMSPLHSASPTLSPSSKSDAPHSRRDANSGTIFVCRRQPTTSVSDTHSRRHHVKRTMPDMVPSSTLNLSSSSEETDSDDESGRRSVKPHVVRGTPANGTKSRPTVTRKAAAILPAALDSGGPKVMIGRQLWPMQEEAAYCHQCRNKTMALKLDCRQCSKAFCIRCLTLRYPDEPRALEMKEGGCPACLEYCNCTSCCKKRGVEYISTKDALAGGAATRAQLSARGNSRFPSSHVSSSFSSPPSPSPSSSPKISLALTLTGGVYWGVVYAADGSRIGAGFIPAKQDAKERTSAVLSEPIPEAGANGQPRTKKKRVYVGMIHPSWQFNSAVKKCVLDPIPPPKKVHQSRRPRKYVGNKAFLFYKSEKMVRELADLSPLSSLEEDWEQEDGKMVLVEPKEQDTIGIVGTAGNDDQSLREGSKDDDVSLSDDDVMRAIGLGLHACGIKLAG